MDKNAPTIKDISKRLNISSVSVHRALSGKEGVSDELRHRILQLADELGYKVNYAASSLKRKPCRIAVVMPAQEGMYYSYIWDGLRDCYNDVKGLNIEIIEMPCNNERHQYELIRQLADDKDMVSGVITFSYTRDRQVLMQLQRLLSLNVVIVVIDDELSEPEGIYCIPPNEQAIAGVAAEFMSLIVKTKGTVLVTSGRLSSRIHQNKIEIFTKQLRQLRPELSVRLVEEEDGHQTEEGTSERMQTALKLYPDTVACYSITSLSNLGVVNAVERLGLGSKVMILGTDFNRMTRTYLNEGRMLAVVNQGAYKKGFLAFRVITDKIIKNIEPIMPLTYPVDLILKSNANYYDNEAVR